MSSSSRCAAIPAKGELIRTLRLQRGLTQGQLAARAGISEWQLSRIECAKADPSRETLERLAPVLNVSVAYFDAEALAEAVAAKAADPVTRTLVERVLKLHDRIATMAPTELQLLYALLDDLESRGRQ